MVNSLAEGIAYARAHPTRDGGSWAGWCASFVYRFGGFSRSFSNAMAAGDWQEDRGRLRRDWNVAPAGAIHYWAGVGGDGHTAVDLGNNTLLMASGSVSNFGTALGTISFQSYANKGIPYRGWSMYWGDEALIGGGTAGGNATPIEEGEDMPLTDADVQKIWTWMLGNPAGMQGRAADWLTNLPDQVKAAVDGIWQADLTTSDGAIHGVAGQWLPNIGQTVGVINAKSTDVAALSQAIAAAVVKALPSGSDAVAIASAVDAVLADNFAKVNANIDDQPTTFEITPKG